jgi:hypothetical protein
MCTGQKIGSDALAKTKYGLRGLIGLAAAPIYQAGERFCKAEMCEANNAGITTGAIGRRQRGRNIRSDRREHCHPPADLIKQRVIIRAQTLRCELSGMAVQEREAGFQVSGIECVSEIFNKASGFGRCHADRLSREPAGGNGMICPSRIWKCISVKTESGCALVVTIGEALLKLWLLSIIGTI